MTSGDRSDLVVGCVLGFVGAVVFALVATLLAVSLGASTERRKDVIFVGPVAHCIGDAVECAESLHFNGDWDGTKLCRGYAHHSVKCVKFEEVFGEKRNGPVEQ